MPIRRSIPEASWLEAREWQTGFPEDSGIAPSTGPVMPGVG